ncbi:Hypothetical protein R9X50_00624000 [Acrodontium crateriforme]|uniref:Pathway-specific nitrogen regulator n=1 Tax=Acrodontium crateriforme TaxID=150365 RepID=A0AAQ3RBH2_9PEZI|nr:Hypothetical protein R9X50_00624000 [Acrodontium crateriforme]
MARQRHKAHPFTIWADTGIPTPEPESKPSFDESCAMQDRLESSQFDCRSSILDDDIWEDQEEVEEVRDEGHGALVSTNEGEDRRESGMARTSISSLPESEYHADILLPARSPQMIRPSFMRPESVRRMQMSSPPPFHSRSPRVSLQRLSRSRPATPKSVRSANLLGSPRPKAIIHEDSDEDEKHYPLVLLHITILPVELPWSAESMHALLPKTTMDNLHLIKAKVSDTIFQRGILIPHPGEEYELLEDRLLEALELTQERVTKCGHFRNRSSVSSGLSFDSGRGSDSAMGGSIDCPIGEQCTTCGSPVKDSRFGTGQGDRRWSVRVFAANGLMRSAAWSAAWSEMESVDVEILPWISEEMKITLDERREEEEIEMQARGEIEEPSSRPDTGNGESLLQGQEGMSPRPATASKIETIVENRRDGAEPIEQTPGTSPSDLPQIYRKSEIPLSLLLRNYVFLLAQDRRNIAALILALLSIVWMLQPAGTSGPDISSTSSAPHPEVKIPEESILKLTSANVDIPVKIADITSMMDIVHDTPTNADISDTHDQSLESPIDPKGGGKSSPEDVQTDIS